mgnify:CR=1 FL=1
MSTTSKYELIYKHSDHDNWGLIGKFDDINSPEFISQHSKYSKKDTTEEVRVIKVTTVREVIAL